MLKCKTKLFLSAATAGFLGFASQTFAVHPTVGSYPGIPLRDATGAVITATSTVPYSPKQTCGMCHDYGSGWTTSTKTQYNRSGDILSYDVPYPQHGVSAGYHFQQGRNIDWDDTQRTAYGLPEFTSSAGMYGKY